MRNIKKARLLIPLALAVAVVPVVASSACGGKVVADSTGTSTSSGHGGNGGAGGQGGNVPPDAIAG